MEGKIPLKMLTTPTYITDVERFADNLRRFGNALRSEYTNARIGYSLKTNYHTPFILKVKELGEMAEVVSYEEYKIALCCGFKPTDIIYNGVIPDNIAKVDLARKGGVVNFDNPYELSVIASCLHGAEVGMRLTFDMPDRAESRFGLDVGNTEQMEYLIDTSRHSNFRVAMLHCHFSGARRLDQFRHRVQEMARYARMFHAHTIDIGGGMFGELSPEFAKQYDCPIPTLEEYAHEIGAEMKRQLTDESVRLIVEGGTPFLTNAMHLLTRIINVKPRGSIKLVTLNCRNEDVGWTCRYKQPVVQSLCNGESADCTLFGCECTETDIIRESFRGPVADQGLMLIRDIGAYSSNLVNDFIKPGCREFIDISRIEDAERIVGYAPME